MSSSKTKIFEVLALCLLADRGRVGGNVVQSKNAFGRLTKQNLEVKSPTTLEFINL
jgi:hypothetical protein